MTQDGYCLIRQLLDPATLNDALTTCQHYAEQSMQYACAHLPCTSETLIETLQQKETEIPQFEKLLQDACCGHLPKEARLSDTILAMAKSPALLNHLRKLLNSDRIYLHMPPVARFILPHNQVAAVPPHQDISYNTHMPYFLTVWAPLVPIDEQCGGVLFFPQKNNPTVLPQKAKTGYWLGEVDVSGLTPVSFIMEPGDVLIFDPHTVHSSAPNRSNHTRYSVDFRFFSDEVSSTKHYFDFEKNEIIPPTGESYA